jgi:acyl-CoA-binding protein
MGEDLKSRFQKAAADARTLHTRPSNDDLLQLYALYKQATEGDVSGKRPGMLDVKGRAKYDAWAHVQGRTRDSAMEAYVALVGRLASR